MSDEQPLTGKKPRRRGASPEQMVKVRAQRRKKGTPTPPSPDAALGEYQATQTSQPSASAPRADMLPRSTEVYVAPETPRGPRVLFHHVDGGRCWVHKIVPFGLLDRIEPRLTAMTHEQFRQAGGRCPAVHLKTSGAFVFYKVVLGPGRLGELQRCTRAEWDAFPLKTDAADIWYRQLDLLVQASRRVVNWETPAPDQAQAESIRLQLAGLRHHGYRFYVARDAMSKLTGLLDGIDNDSELCEVYHAWLAALTPAQFAEFNEKLTHYERMLDRQSL